MLTQAMEKAGVHALPPVEIDTNEFVSESVDITDARVVHHIKMLIQEGYLLYIHFGTPCSSFSQARRNDGGPPPLRNEEYITGLPGLSQLDQAKVEMGNFLLDVTVELIKCCQQHGVKWSIEILDHLSFGTCPA